MRQQQQWQCQSIASEHLVIITNHHLEVSSNGRESNATVLRFMSQTETPSIRWSTFAPFQDNGKLLGSMGQGEVFAD